jgi:hypothetical protein
METIHLVGLRIMRCALPNAVLDTFAVGTQSLWNTNLLRLTSCTPLHDLINRRRAFYHVAIQLSVCSSVTPVVQYKVLIDRHTQGNQLNIYNNTLYRTEAISISTKKLQKLL